MPAAELQITETVSQITERQVLPAPFAAWKGPAFWEEGVQLDITKRQITKIAREVGKFTVRTMKEEGVGTAEFDLIHVVRKRPGITQTEICKILGTDKGAVAKQTANLEAKGYLRRENNPADGRSQLIFPTEKAQSLKNSKAHIEALFYEWLAAALSEEDQKEFARLLDILYHRCKAESKADFPEMTARIKECE